MGGVNTIHVANHLYKAYREGTMLVATTELELPAITNMTAEITGADIAGSLDMPILGLIQSMVTKITFRTVTSDAKMLIIPDRQELEFRAAIQVVEGGKHGFKAQKITVGGFIKGLTPGKMAVAQLQDRSFDFETDYYKEIFGDDEVLEIDKLNTIYKVNGKDYLEEVRNIIG